MAKQISFLVISDLHLGTEQHGGRKALDRMYDWVNSGGEFDHVVCLGDVIEAKGDLDISDLGILRGVFFVTMKEMHTKLKKEGRKFVFVPGNHEFHIVMDRGYTHDLYSLLDNPGRSCDGWYMEGTQSFAGFPAVFRFTTLWPDGSLYRGEHKKEIQEGTEAWFSKEYKNLGREFHSMSFLEGFRDVAFRDKPNILFSHHAPTPDLLIYGKSPKWDMQNYYMGVDLTEELKELDFAVCGHIHREQREGNVTSLAPGVSRVTFRVEDDGTKSMTVEKI